jgi:hypothetical protein
MFQENRWLDGGRWCARLTWTGINRCRAWCGRTLQGRIVGDERNAQSRRGERRIAGGAAGRQWSAVRRLAYASSTLRLGRASLVARRHPRELVFRRPPPDVELRGRVGRDEIDSAVAIDVGCCNTMDWQPGPEEQQRFRFGEPDEQTARRRPVLNADDVGNAVAIEIGLMVRVASPGIAWCAGKHEGGAEPCEEKPTNQRSLRTHNVP